MKLAEVSIKRPVFTVMMILTLVVLGVTSFFSMSTDLMPEVDFPFVMIRVVYPGASASAVETDVIKKIEDAVNPINGVKHLSGSSQEGYGFVFVQFNLEKDEMIAAQEVREKVSAIRDQLPEDIEEPIIAQFDPNDEPIISLTVSGERPLREITEYTKDNVQKILEAVPGIGSVDLVGGYEREINVFLDIDKMESYEIPVDKVRNAIMMANLEIPGGRVNELNREYVVRTMGKLSRVEEFKDIVIDNPHGQPVYLKDIATVVDGVEEQRSLARVNGVSAVALDIYRRSGGNTVDAARTVKEEVSRLNEIMPRDMKIDIIVDNSIFIEDAIHDVTTNIYWGGLLAVLVIFIFLADYRTTIISGIAIPVSIIATFTLMNALGFTLNMLSMMALAIGVGLLIDDAIVVIENIYRRLESGEKAMDAAFKGTKEIGLAVMATTFSIVVVFLPVAYMKGIVGRFFFQFGMTVAFSVLVSLFVAFTLTPMLASRWLKINSDTQPKTAFGRVAHKIYMLVLRAMQPWNRLIDRVNVKYRGALAWSLRHRLIIMSLATIMFVGAIFLGGMAGIEFMPVTDQGRIVIPIETPPGTDLQATSDRLNEVEKRVREKMTGIDLIYTTVGRGQDNVNQATIYIKLVDTDHRDFTAQAMIDSVRNWISDIPGIEYAVMSEVGDGGATRQATLSLRGNDRDILSGLAKQAEKIMREIPGAVDIQNSEVDGKPELRVNIDRKLANDLGINVYSIGSTIRTLVEGDVITRFKDGDEEHDVRIRLKEKDRENSAQIGRILVESNKEIEGTRTFLVPLSNFASMSKTTAIAEYQRYDRLPQIVIGANAASGFFAGTIVQAAQDRMEQEIDFPAGYYIAKTGMSEIQAESFGYMFESLILAIIFIYIVLASQFESFFDPLSIMASLPLSMIGALILLVALGNSISIMSLIGIIMLMGLVTKNAILLIDFVKQNRHKGVDRTEAILRAGPIRLRPILMTALSLIFGVLPVALGIGQGAEMRAPMARAVIGGMASSTLLTLIVVPVVYTIIDDIVAFFLKRETVQVNEKSIENA